MGGEGDEPRHRRQQSAQSEEEGLEPTKEWVKDLVDEIIAQEFARAALARRGRSEHGQGRRDARSAR